MKSLHTLGLLGIMFVMLAGMVSAGAYDDKNDTIATDVNITNAQPKFSELPTLDDFDSENDAETMDLKPNTTKTIYCNGEVFDFDGTTDISNINATIWSDTTTQDAADAELNHYTNESCNWTTVTDSSTNASFNCTVDVWYYAEPGEWHCNVSVNDSSGEKDTATDNATMNKLVAMDINQSTVDFGDMDLGANTTKNFTFQNQGNVGLDAEIDAWEVGGNYTSDLAMNCSYNNIGISNMTSGNSTTNTYSEMTPMNQSGYLSYPNLDLMPQTTGSTPTSDLFNLGLMIPETVGGVCQGVVSLQVSENI